jgi:hypothetical protein
LKGAIRYFQAKEITMADTETRAERIVAGEELYLRRASAAERWEITLYDRTLNAPTALTDGILRSEQLIKHPVLQQTFATPDEAAAAVHRVVA